MSYRIAITGEFRRGKDTLANLIEEQIPSSEVLARFAFAYALKREVANMVEAYVVSTDPAYSLARLHDRNIMAPGWQWWGEFRRRTCGNDYWINELDRNYSGFTTSQPDGSVIITDMRHHNEAAWCRGHGFFLIRIVGPCRAEGGSEQRDPNHPSEVHVRELPVDLEIQNTSGLEALRECVKSRVMPRLREFFDAKLSG